MSGQSHRNTHPDASSSRDEAPDEVMVRKLTNEQIKENAQPKSSLITPMVAHEPEEAQLQRIGETDHGESYRNDRHGTQTKDPVTNGNWGDAFYSPKNKNLEPEEMTAEELARASRSVTCPTCRYENSPDDGNQCKGMPNNQPCTTTLKDVVTDRSRG